MAKEIIFRFKDGKVQMEGKDFSGGECEKAMKEFEEALGGKVTRRKKKREYYEKSTTKKTVDHNA